MDKVERSIRSLSPSQLRALYYLAKSKEGIISSIKFAKEIGKEGKALGAIFSSLSRRRFQGDFLLIPFGRESERQSLRWKLNERLIKKEILLSIIEELIKG